MNFYGFEKAVLLIFSMNSWKLLTLAGYRNSFTNPKSSPVANTLLSLVRHEAVTSVTSPIIGQIPSQHEPKTLVHDAQPIFSTYKNNLFETENASSQVVFFHIWFQEKVLALKDKSHLKDNIFTYLSFIFWLFQISFETLNFTFIKFQFQNL